MIILWDEATLFHETVELLGAKVIPALESPERIRAIVEAVKHDGHHDLRAVSASDTDQQHALDLARRTHQSDYLDHYQNVHKTWLKAGLIEIEDSVLPECFRLQSVAQQGRAIRPPKDIYARAGYYAFDMSTSIMKSSWRSIIASANLAVQAAILLSQARRKPKQVPGCGGDGDVQKAAAPCVEDEATTIVALTRPPGHHCTGAQAGGYCYINNIVLALSELRSRHSASLDAKAIILDLDFHHGNGTQELTWTDPNTIYISLHGEDEFPYYTGFTDETGPAAPHPAASTTFNYPLPTRSSLEQYLEKLDAALTHAEKAGGEYLLVSLGFDTFHLDPLGKFEIETQDYCTIASRVRERIRMPSLILLEGGYVVDRLGPNLLSFLGGWQQGEASVQ